MKGEDLFLRMNGWRPTDDGWKHPKLAHPWPIMQAVQLQKEADEGAQDPAHRILRGEI